MSTERGGPVFGALAFQLGRERFERFWTGHAEITANLLALTLSTAMAKGADYADDVLDAIEVDANDLEKAAKKHAAACRRLAREWRTQKKRPQG
jgi:alcohol dehydrogenase class IV